MNSEEELFVLNIPPSLSDVLQDRIEFFKIDKSLFGWLMSLNEEMYSEVYRIACSTTDDKVDEQFSYWILIELLEGDLTIGRSFSAEKFDKTADMILSFVAIMHVYKQVGTGYTVGKTDDDWDWEIDLDEAAEVYKEIPFIIRITKKGGKELNA